MLNILIAGGREGAMALLGALRDCPTLFPDLLTLGLGALPRVHSFFFFVTLKSIVE